MSHFYGRLEGSAKEITRQGTKGSGIRCTLSTFEHKVRVSLSHDGGALGGGVDRLVLSIDGVILFETDLRATTPQEIVRRIAHRAVENEFA